MTQVTPKVKFKEDGSLTASLPISGIELTLRAPKAKDLKAVQRAAKVPEATNIDLTWTLVKNLCLKWGSESYVSVDTLDELDLGDALALEGILGHFRDLKSFIG